MNQTNLTSSLNQTIEYPSILTSPPMKWSTTVICLIGIVSCILATCTIWRKLFKDHTSFFILMFLITILDFGFDFFYMIYQLSDKNTLANIIIYGFAYASSLASDLCTLALTTQRYFVLKWPHKKLSERAQRVVQVTSGILITLISITRFQFIFERDEVVLYIKPEIIDYYKSHVYYYLSTITNMVLPFLLVVLMGIFTGQIILVVIRRKKVLNIGSVQPKQVAWTQESMTEMTPVTAKKAEKIGKDHDSIKSQGATVERGLPSSSNNVQENYQQRKRDQKNEQIDSAISLVLLLDAFFFLNQVGYCIYTIAEIYEPSCGYCEIGMRWKDISECISDLCECLSHSLNFYFYLRFSTMMKDEFWAFMGRVRGMMVLGCRRVVE